MVCEFIVDGHFEDPVNGLGVVAVDGVGEDDGGVGEDGAGAVEGAELAHCAGPFGDVGVVLLGGITSVAAADEGGCVGVMCRGGQGGWCR